MAILLFRLRGVPDDEADEVRGLLSAHKIDFYETSAGNWGISMPAIWLRDPSQLDAAKSLIEHYQAQRAERVRSEYEQLKIEGKNRTILDEIKEEPLRFIAYLLIVLVILYLSIMPFIDLGK